MLLMALDPGVRTGAAAYLSKSDGTGQYLTATLQTPEEVMDWIVSIRPQHLAFERFSTGGRVDQYMLHTIELVGAIAGVCYALKIQAHRQTPQERRSFLIDAMEVFAKTHHRQPVMTKDKDDHEIDALAHLLRLQHRLTTQTQTKVTTTPMRNATNTMRVRPRVQV